MIIEIEVIKNGYVVRGDLFDKEKGYSYTTSRFTPDARTTTELVRATLQERETTKSRRRHT